MIKCLMLGPHPLSTLIKVIFEPFAMFWMYAFNNLFKAQSYHISGKSGYVSRDNPRHSIQYMYWEREPERVVASFFFFFITSHVN